MSKGLQGKVTWLLERWFVKFEEKILLKTLATGLIQPPASEVPRPSNQRWPGQGDSWIGLWGHPTSSAHALEISRVSITLIDEINETDVHHATCPTVSSHSPWWWTSCWTQTWMLIRMSEKTGLDGKLESVTPIVPSWIRIGAKSASEAFLNSS
jgi:hypothetical protein